MEEAWTLMGCKDVHLGNIHELRCHRIGRTISGGKKRYQEFTGDNEVHFKKRLKSKYFLRT